MGETATATTTTTTVTARPKTSRRPATFSGSPSGAAQPADWVALAPHDAAPKVTDIVASKSWQDDPRFAVALLLLVVLVNIAVSLWLSAITPIAAKTEQSIAAESMHSEAEDVHLLDETSEQ